MKKVFKKSIACLIAVLMVFSAMPLTAFAAETLNKIDNNLGTANFNSIFYGGIDYIAINYEGVNPDKQIIVKEGTTSVTVKSVSNYHKNRYSDQNAVLAAVKNSRNAYWYYGEGGDYCVTTSNEHSLSGTGITITASGFGKNKNANNTYRDGKTTDITTTYTIDTSTLAVGTYNLTYSFNYQMKEYSWFKWSTQKEYSGTETFQLVVEHDYQTDNTTYQAPTCTTAGKEADKVCSVCKDRIKGATISALGHDYQTDNATSKEPTCTTDGKEADQFCTRCNDIIKGEKIPVNPDAHNWGKWTSISDTQHQRKCTNDNSHTEEENHTFENGVCKVCTKQQTFTIKFKNQDGSEISSIVYNYGDPVAIPALPPTEYTYNNGTHTVTTYSWNSKPNPVAQDNATYQVTATNSSPVACNFVLKDTTTVDGKTIDTLECSVCKGTIDKTVADMSALNHAIEQLEALVNDDGANYKYEANALADAKNVVATAKDFVQKADKYAPQKDVDDKASTVNGTITTLTTTGLAQYTVTFNLVNADTGDPIKTDYSVMKYGDIAEKSYTFNKDEDGFPEYVVCKWTKKVLNDKGEAVESVINSTSNDISVVVKENATYTCYVLKFKASTEGATQTTTRVRYLDKSGHTLKIAYATVGSKYEIDESVVAPKLPYYRFTEWERVYGENNPVGTRELVYQARYSYSDSEANVCEIVGLGGVKVNGAERCSAIYDSKVVLTGATKYAFCDKDGNKIISYINEDYIYTPRVNETVYIKAVVEEVTTATTAITGSFVQKDAGTLSNGTKYHNLYVNAQFYLPEGATVVEAGLVLSKSVSEENELQIGKENVTKLVSNSQGTNHEYSMAMSFTKDGTVHARSYLIYVDKSGTTHTVYSAVKTINYKAQGGADNE